jgi:hypothetical protein
VRSFQPSPNPPNWRLTPYQVRFHVLTATSMKMAVFWDAAPCSLVDTDWRFRGAYCLNQTVYFHVSSSPSPPWSGYGPPPLHPRSPVLSVCLSVLAPVLLVRPSFCLVRPAPISKPINHPDDGGKSQRPSAKAIPTLLGSTPREASNQNSFHKEHVAWCYNPPPAAIAPSLTQSRPSATTNTPLA